MVDRSRPARRRARIASAVLAGLAILAASCGGEPAPTELADRVGPLPEPTGEVVLTVEGAGLDGAVRLDIAGIESLGPRTITVFEPFVAEELEFTGVPVDLVLAAAGVGPDTPLTWTALDDYQVHFTRRAAAADEAFLATRQAGEAIPVADGGPIRVLFPDREGELAQDTNQWIWSLYRIDAG